MPNVLIIASILFFCVCGEGYAVDKKLRFAGSTGMVLQNDLLGQEISSGFGGTGAAGFAIAYPVSEKDHIMNVELAIANWYNFFPYNDNCMHTLRFGFGIRVFLNILKSIRPYFTHDICSHIIWVHDKPEYAATFGILLGLGVDVPIKTSQQGSWKDQKESSSVFFDISFNTFSVAVFDPSHETARFLSFSFGYSLLLPGKNKAKSPN
jgi:hypothetical protein